jgi:hypothetical protein
VSASSRPGGGGVHGADRQDAAQAVDLLDDWIQAGAAGDPPPGIARADALLALRLSQAAAALQPRESFVESLAAGLAATPVRSHAGHLRWPAATALGLLAILATYLVWRTVGVGPGSVGPGGYRGPQASPSHVAPTAQAGVRA